MNAFVALVETGELTSLDDLRSFYKTELKRLHPDLRGPAAPQVDFDRLKRDYAEALRLLTDRLSPEDETPPAAFDKEALLDECRELVARGFPVNIQAATKNRAYAASIRRVSKAFDDLYDDGDFFPRANREARALKRFHPKLHWYVLQIFWNLGDWRVTGYDYYRRVFVRHLEFIRETLEDEGYLTLLLMLEYLTK